MVALLSPRVAHNFAKNGYYPTDDATTNAIVSHFVRTDNTAIRVLDPCVGEARAASNITYSISHKAKLYGIEYNRYRADIAEKYCDVLLKSDLFDTVISPNSFGLLFLNPPYGNLTSEHNGAITNYQKDYKRLEKIFYRFTIPSLQYNGILVLIIPFTQLDEMLSNWIASQFTDISIFTACDKQFNQVVIFGRKVRQNDIALQEKNEMKAKFKAIFEGKIVPDEIAVTDKPNYQIPESKSEIKSFYKLSFTDVELEQEVKKIGGLWNDFNLFFKRCCESKRKPLCKMSDWHLSLALAAGEINGIVKSNTGKTYIIKGDTYKSKLKSVEDTLDDEGLVVESKTILTDKFIPSIKAWDFTPYSETFGSLLVISTQINKVDELDENDEHVEIIENNQSCSVLTGLIYYTPGIKFLAEHDCDMALAVSKAFSRYRNGDWGDDMDDSDTKLNDQVLKQGQKNDRLFASYKLSDDTKLWIITEWHDERGFITTLMLPNEY
ncbi:class I SAM-dependent methyltransferase [Gilliamella sp. B2776]|uniref:DUF6094 domain-containing protein n=1 Tax=unclassified Gilliamella TaxID=2685620 RepID=UPI00226A31AD|nr:MULTISPECIES: DUF6094 domain-containing protein [unclassified Gilliamella]MCX8578689.1 class I SAM-dependent methyltransferase [Gilliamella sp. B2717]MCX8649571.1 class I SAM-dependent methyltransferase [Gilliamella sp. B2779]MCX8653854.1 class I SAM-dependent methyltransferase [Gilliamella sp. B2737]MCX8691439.1 class I SAM-dependent methyltransferase [Gilliamella sp. B2776]MCX8702500.1 class I SAM-dependent methyltransferase [Gilliamella sp. B2781]